MTVEQFQTAVDRGMGRAALCLIENDPELYVEPFILAAAFNRQYDWEAEESRAPYLYRLATLAQCEPILLEMILAAFPRAKSPRLRFHYADLLREFAMRGNPRARIALLALALRIDEATGSLAEMGAPALAWIQQARPELFHGEGAESGVALTERACRTSGEATVLAVLNPDAREAWRISRTEEEGEPDPPIRTEEEFRRRYRETEGDLSRLAVVMAFGYHGLEEELLKLAEKMIRWTDRPRLIRKLSRVFWHRPWPLDPHPLIERVDGVDDAAHGWRTILEGVTHPSVRTLALTRLDQTPPDRDALGWLYPNFEPGDEKRVLEALDRIDPQDENHVHSFAIDLYRLARDKGETEFVPHLEWIVENTPCSDCRAKAFERLHVIGALSEAYRREAAYDAEARTRALAPGRGSTVA